MHASAPDDEPGAAPSQRRAREWLDVDAHPQRLFRDELVIEISRELEQDMQSGRHAFDPELGQMLGERTAEAIPPRPIDRADAADVAVVGTGLDQPSQRQLVERGRAEINEQLHSGGIVCEVTRRDQPTESKRGANVFDTVPRYAPAPAAG